MRGRKPRPTALKILDGTRADRINHDEPAMPPASIEPPDWLDETARAHWGELDPGGEPLVIPLMASLPQGYASGVDTLKVLATVKPTSFRQLTLPRLDQPIPSLPPSSSRTRGNESDPLEQLLDAVSADRPPSRDASAVTRPGKEWASAKVQVRITEKPK